MSFVKKADLMAEIWNSKLSYCQIIDPTKTRPDYFVTSRDEVVGEGIFCLFTTDHIEVEARFPAFILIDGATGEITVISHKRAGRMNHRLAKLLITMTDAYALRGNWRGYSWLDEMKSEALLNLVDNVLMFNEAKSDNPHAYITRCLQNSFIRENTKQNKESRRKAALRHELGIINSARTELDS